MVWAAPSTPPSRPRSGPRQVRVDRADPSDGPILVVDDDPGVLAAVRDLLEFEGHSVVAASSGLIALEFVRQVTPSLVLLDMRMPGMDGWSFARALRREGHDVPIVVMTAAANAAAWASEIDAQAYIAKPFGSDELLTAVETHRRS